MGDVAVNIGMQDMDTAIAVLTRKGGHEIIESGGCGGWILNPEHARRQRYLVCCRKGHSAELDADEPHGAAFLVGLIGDLVPLGQTKWGQERYKIGITECARVLYPSIWRNWRNPVRYTSLEELGIDVDALQFTGLEEAFGATAAAPGPQPPRGNVRKLTVAEAKEGLAATLGISPDAIEIIIRS
jgi:hypothetical protein